MVDWVLASGATRLVDPGCGTGRFSAMALRQKPSVTIIAVDTDPLATLIARSTFAVLGANKVRVLNTDYTGLEIPAHRGRTAYIGNPPYVRFHDVSKSTKNWARSVGREIGHPVSGLAGLHAIFYLATAHKIARGDVGCFITSAEWLDVNYGSVIRNLLLDGLGGRHIVAFEPTAVPFAGIKTTGLITCFQAGSAHGDLTFRSVQSPSELKRLDRESDVRTVDRGKLRSVERWSPYFQRRKRNMLTGMTLGSIVRVHRGQSTGANAFFVMTKARARELGIMKWCKPAITSGREIVDANGDIRDDVSKLVVLDFPKDLDRKKHEAADSYLRQGEHADDGSKPVASCYTAKTRRPWWRVNLPSPPIVVTYMARQAPVFALNPDGLGVLNVAHGLYPREHMSRNQLRLIVSKLNAARESFKGKGRTYFGGLEKFEPREIENLPLPATLMHLVP